MSVLNQSGEEQVECPLCMEPLEVDDLNFFPCTCGYQICRFCWHRIRTDENGLCPACRKAYPENPADFKPLSQEEVAKLKAEKRHKDQQRKQKITENRKHLANVRVVQRNLVFVVGLPMRLADSEVLKKHEYFGKFGKIHKVVINQSTSYAGTQGPSASAYVTYHKADDALRAIQAVNNIVVDGRSIKSSLGTTKYCSHFMKNQPCPKPDCMYLHDQGDPEASFTKEEMQQGKHQEYERRLHETLINATSQRERKPTPSPPSAALGGGGGPAPGLQQAAWPSLQPGATLTTGGSSSSGSSNGTTKGDNSRKQNATKNLSKKRHSSGDDSRGKAREKPGEEEAARSGEPPSASESASLDSDDGGGRGEDVSPSRPPLGRTAALFEPDNNSFFSTNAFTKVAACSQASSGGGEWPTNGGASHLQPQPPNQFPDSLQLHTTEDWQAAFSSHIAAEAEAEAARTAPDGKPSKFLAEFRALRHGESDPLLGTSRLESANFTKNHLDPSKYVKNMQNVHLDSSSYLVNSLPSSHEASNFGNGQTVRSHSDSSSYGSGKFNRSLGDGPSATQNGRRLQNGDVLEENGFMDVGSYQRKVNEAEKYLNYRRKLNSSELGELGFDGFKYGKCDDLAKDFGIGEDCANDDLGFDPFHETQKGFAEIMGGDVGNGGLRKHHESDCFSSGNYQHTNHLSNPALGFNHVQPQNSFGGSKVLPTMTQQQQQQILAQQNHRLSGGLAVAGCTKLLEGLGLAAAPSPRTRLPPPGFSTAPNHMNSFGLGIPRAPSSNGSKILPFMGLGSSNGGSLSPAPPPPQQQQQQQAVLLGGAQLPRGFSLPNGLKLPGSGGGDPTYSVKDWSENLRGLIPLSASYSPHAPASSSPHGTSSKGWTGPCSDWTALDPAIVSSSRPGLHQGSAHPTSTHWLGNLEENNSPYFGGQLPDWSSLGSSSSLAGPPPGFSVRQQNKTLSATADMTKMENL